MKLEVITGCMYSQKTETFIAKINELRESGKEVVVLKPMQDSRYARHDVVSHSGIRTKGVAIDDLSEIWEYIEGIDVLAIDEVQFFENWDFVDVINDIVSQGVEVILSGLNLDFKGRPYGVMPMIMASADVLHLLHATCSVCGKEATRSQRLVNGKPASVNDPVHIVSEHITYEPRCRSHHELRM